MNRSILIVICDFLLVSLLVFSTPDTTKITGETGTAAVPASEQSTNAPSGGKDLAMVMRSALTEEQQKREQLQSEREQLRSELDKSRKTAEQRQQQLTQSEKRSQEIQKQQNDLQQQYATAQTNLTALNQQLTARSTEATITKEQLTATQADIKKQEDQAAALKKQLADLEKANQAALAEQQRLTNQLQMADLERKHAAEMAAAAQQQVQVEREEKAQLQQQNTKLAEGVKTLANKSGELAQEIRENRPLASNTIFNDFVTNAVDVSFTASKPGVFGGEATKDRITKTVLITDGTNTFAVCHVQDTPMTFWIPPKDWDSMSVSLRHNDGQLPIPAFSFAQADPRLVLMPVSRAEVSQLNTKVYRMSGDPFKFQDAVLVGAADGYYGECKFQIDMKTPDYVRLDRSVLKGLFGKFNPSRGDLVFSRTGEILGIMANDSYCLVIRKFNATSTFHLDHSLRAQHLSDTLAYYYVSITKLPGELQ